MTPDVDVRVSTVAGSSGPLEARLYRAHGRRAATGDTLVVFFHGGGFTSGSLDAADPCLRDLAERLDAALLAPAYAQAADQPFPAAAEDAYAALLDVAAKPRRFGWNGRRLIVGGVEAGGNLAAVAALMARDRGGPKLAGQLLVSPMLDPGLATCSMRQAGQRKAGDAIASRCAEGYRGYLPRAADRTHPYASPLVSTRLKGLPPTLMVSIDGDPLRDEADAYVAKLAAAGVPVTSVVMATPPEAEALIDPNARCRASADDGALIAMAHFVATASLPPRSPQSSEQERP